MATVEQSLTSFETSSLQMNNAVKLIAEKMSTKENLLNKKTIITDNVIDLTEDRFFNKVVSSNITLNVINTPTANSVLFYLELDITASSVISWWATVKWPSGTLPVLGVGKHFLTFVKNPNDSYWVGFLPGNALA